MHAYRRKVRAMNELARVTPITTSHPPMTLEAAVRLGYAIAEAAGHRVHAEDLVTTGRTLAERLAAADPAWCHQWIAVESRAARTVSAALLVTAWRIEAQRRVEAVTIPAAPPGVESDGARWQQWETARRRALIAGATAAESVATADAAVGATRPVESVVTPDAAAASKAAVVDFLAYRRRRFAAVESDTDDVTGGAR